MSAENKINMFTKQNDSIYASLMARDVEFIRIDMSSIDNQDEKLVSLVNENKKLIALVNENKMKNKKEVDKKPAAIVNENKVKNKKKEVEENEDEELLETLVQAQEIQKFNTICNMEDIKRAFCNAEYETFENLVQAHPFKYYQVEYKYASDKDGAPEFIAKNLLRGFVRNIDDYRKYFFVGFRCILTDLENKIYTYPSMWIVNSTDPIQTIIGSVYEDFEFIEIAQENILQFLVNFRKTNFDEVTNVVDEIYAH